MSKTLEKRLTILDTALSLVRQIGFESVSIASLASEVGMSKSGLFAHFNSKEKMHLMILDHAAESFSEEIFKKAISTSRGVPRLRAIIKNWIKWYKTGEGGTCPFIAASVEYDSKKGPVKNRIKSHMRQLISSLSYTAQVCIEEGHFKKETNTDLFAYELYSLIVGHLVYLRTMESKSANKLFEQSIEQLIEKYLS